MMTSSGLEPTVPDAPGVRELDPEFRAWLDRVTSHEPVRGRANIVVIAPRGHGVTAAPATYLTWWRRVDLTATIVGPGHGRWRVRVTDLATHRVLFESSAVPPGVPVRFCADTAFKFRPQVEAWWSERADARLTLRLDYRF